MNDMDLLRKVGADGSHDDDDLAMARSAALHRLRTAIDREEHVATRRTRGWRDPTFRRLVLAGGAAALVAVAVVAFALSALRPPAAVARLDRLAVVAERVQRLQPTSSGFVYTRSRSVVLVQEVGSDGQTISFLAHQDTERWLNAAGQLRIRQVYGAPEFFRAEDEAAFAAAGLGGVYGEGVVEDRLFEPAEVLETTLNDWSTDPEELREQMVAELDRAGDPEVPQPTRLLELGSMLLQAPGAQPELRAAVLRVLADEDGVGITSAPTPGGAPGIVAHVDYTVGGNSFSRRVVFDAATSRLVRQEVVALDPLPGGIPAGTAIRSRVNEPSVQVPTIDAPPTTG